VIVRPFELHEWQLLRRLRLAALAESPEAFLRRLAEEQQRSDAEWSGMLPSVVAAPSQISFVAELNGRAVGLVYCQLETEDQTVAHLQAMWVAPEARGAGVGRALVEAVLAWARARSVCRVVLHVTENNGPALRLYAQAGFVIVGGPAPFRADSPLLALTMALELSGCS